MSQIEFGGADERSREGAERVAECGSLRDRRHLHQTERYSDERTDDQANDNPLIADDAAKSSVARIAISMPDFAGQNAAPRGSRRTEPFEREYEKRYGDDDTRSQ